MAAGWLLADLWPVVRLAGLAAGRKSASSLGSGALDSSPQPPTPLPPSLPPSGPLEHPRPSTKRNLCLRLHAPPADPCTQLPFPPLLRVCPPPSPHRHCRTCRLWPCYMPATLGTLPYAAAKARPASIPPDLT